MASSARRDPVGELAVLLRAPEPESTNLGDFAAANASRLAPALEVPAGELEALEAVLDEVSAPRLRELVDRHRHGLLDRDEERRHERSLAAASRLGEAARWTDLGAELDVEVLLGELLADRTRRWVSFVEPGGFQVKIPRYLIAAAKPLRTLHLDLAAYVDEKGLHFRWRGGRGGYNWHPREVHASFASSVLAVPLRPRVVMAPPERRRGGAWLQYILKELGYV